MLFRSFEPEDIKDSFSGNKAIQTALKDYLEEHDLVEEEYIDEEDFDDEEWD